MVKQVSPPFSTFYVNATMETMPSEQRATWVNQQLQAIVQHAFSEASAVRTIFEQAGLTPGDVATVADLDKVPVIRKDHLIDLQRTSPPFGGFLGVPISSLKRIYQSPGPLYDPEGDRPDYWRWAQALHAAGFGPGDIVQNTAAYHLTPLGFMFDEALRVIGCTVIPAGPGNHSIQLEMMRELGATGYTGLPSYLMNLIEHAERQGLDWRRDFCLSKAFVIAEPFPPSLRRAFAERGITARDGYGTAETGNLGFECEQGHGWHIPYDVIVQVVDLNTGQALPPDREGEIVVTLLEPTYPLIRFGTGDLSALHSEPCACGRTTQRLVGWLGRVGQAVKVRGLFVHPRQVAQALAKFPTIARHQTVIDRPGTMDRLTITLEPTPGASLSGQLNAIDQALRDVIKLQARFDVVEPGTLPAGAPALEDLRTWD